MILVLTAMFVLPYFMSKSKFINSRDFKNTKEFCGNVDFVGYRFYKNRALPYKTLSNYFVDLSSEGISKTFILLPFVDDFDRVLAHKKGDKLCLIYGVNNNGNNELIRIS